MIRHNRRPDDTKDDINFFKMFYFALHFDKIGTVNPIGAGQHLVQFKFLKMPPSTAAFCSPGSLAVSGVRCARCLA